MGNASKLAVLGGGNGLIAFGQVNKLVEMAHHNYKQRMSDTHQLDPDEDRMDKGRERTVQGVS